jgi:hypothetical protein
MLTHLKTCCKKINDETKQLAKEFRTLKLRGCDLSEILGHASKPIRYSLYKMCMLIFYPHDDRSHRLLDVAVLNAD